VDSVSIASHRDGSTGVVVLAGELDLHGRHRLETTVEALVADGADHISVEAGDLTFIDSSGLAALLMVKARVEIAGATFRLGPVTKAVARVIDVAGLTDELEPGTG
jgi:anti-sigma B factor antagonist